MLALDFWVQLTSKYSWWKYYAKSAFVLWWHDIKLKYLAKITLGEHDTQVIKNVVCGSKGDGAQNRCVKSQKTSQFAYHLIRCEFLSYGHLWDALVTSRGSGEPETATLPTDGPEGPGLGGRRRRSVRGRHCKRTTAKSIICSAGLV